MVCFLAVITQVVGGLYSEASVWGLTLAWALETVVGGCTTV